MYKDYQQEALKTVAFPKEHALSYPMLGLVNEIGEYLEKVISYQVYNTDGDVVFHDPAHKEDLTDELGDVFWYIAVLSHYADLDVETLFTDGIKKVGKLTVKFNNDPYLGMIMSSTIASGIVKKIIRKDKPSVENKLPESTKKKLQNALSDVVFFVAQAIREQKLFSTTDTEKKLVESFKKIMDRNVAKLQDRAERGVIKGNGDKR